MVSPVSFATPALHVHGSKSVPAQQSYPPNPFGLVHKEEEQNSSSDVTHGTDESIGNAELSLFSYHRASCNDTFSPRVDIQSQMLLLSILPYITLSGDSFAVASISLECNFMCSKKVEFEKVSSTNCLTNTKYLSCKLSSRSKGPTNGFSLKCLRRTNH